MTSYIRPDRVLNFISFLLTNRHRTEFNVSIHYYYGAALRALRSNAIMACVILISHVMEGGREGGRGEGGQAVAGCEHVCPRKHVTTTWVGEK